MEEATGLKASGQPETYFEFFNPDQFKEEVPEKERSEFEKYKNNGSQQ